jgi:hypothetical protein
MTAMAMVISFSVSEKLTRIECLIDLHFAHVPCLPSLRLLSDWKFEKCKYSRQFGHHRKSLSAGLCRFTLPPFS